MFKYCVRNKYALMFYVVLTIYAGYSIGKAYGFTFFPDEFGYWAYAARAAGYDWSHITALGSYYSYGYSLVLFPIFKIFSNSVTAYRVAVGLNFILIGISYIVIVYLGQKICRMERDESHIISAIAMSYPCVLFYGKSTMVEVLLSTVYIMICALIYAYIQKGKPATLILLVLCLAYIHFVHMRAVGVLIAGVMTLLAYYMIESGKFRHIVITVAGVVMVLAIGFAIKKAIQTSVYNGETAVSDINDYAGQLYKIKYIFTKNGIKDFIEGLSGKLLYMGLSTFGLAWYGIIHIFKQVFQKNNNRHKIVYIFILLSTTAEILINTIYNIKPIRVDNVTYGRYHEFVFPVLIMLGAYEMAHMGNKVRIAALVIMSVIQAGFTRLSADCIIRYGLTNYHGYVMAGMSYVYNGSTYEPVRYIWQAYIFGTVLTVMTIGVFTIINISKRQVIAVTLVVMEIILSLRISGLFTDAAALGTYRDLSVASKIEELLNDKNIENTDRRIIYITDDDFSFISVLQFMMRDEEINLLSVRGGIGEYTNEELNENDILVLFYRSGFASEAAKKYSSYFLNGHFYVFYNMQ